MTTPSHVMNDSAAPTAPVAKQAYAPRSEYERILGELGLTFTEQKGFLKVEIAKGVRLYVASTKTVRRVDLSGFTTIDELALPHRLGKFGNVTQMMRIEGTVAEQLAIFLRLVLAAQEAGRVAEAAEKAKAATASAPSAS